MQIFFYILSFIFFADSVLLTCRGSITLGLFLMYALSCVTFLWAKYYNFLSEISQNGIGFIVKYLIFTFICCYVFLMGYILSYSQNKVTYQENAVIVLGCGLNPDQTPSGTLKKRLDAAVDYHKKNDTAFIVVSGFASRNSTISEAAAMQKYLIQQGVTPSKIILEEKATNTYENFLYSKEMLLRQGLSTENVVYITNSFHVYRAGVYAKKAGFVLPVSLPTSTDVVVFLPALIREVLGVLAMWFLNY